jgi:hypothetical protein
LASALGWSLFPAVFGKRQLVAENLHATKKLFQRDDGLSDEMHHDADRNDPRELNQG